MAPPSGRPRYHRQSGKHRAARQQDPEDDAAPIAGENSVGTYAATTTAALALAAMVAKIVAHLLGVAL